MKKSVSALDDQDLAGPQSINTKISNNLKFPNFGEEKRALKPAKTGL